LAFKDKDGTPLVDKILDTAGQKGTGKWTSIAALDEGVPLTLISEAVYARCLSALKEERIVAAKAFGKTEARFNGDFIEIVADIRQALYAAKIISYAQGYSLLNTAANTYKWDLNYGDIALIWRGGCIIRSAFLEKINEAYTKNPHLQNLMLDDYFKKTLESLSNSFRKVVALAALNGIPVPAMSSALAYFDGYKSEFLPANLLQAQRDYFGAHTYERLDSIRGKFHHTNWTGHGGKTSSSTYNA
jgi:6-phosphogluconate dehydrogenase